MQELDNKEIQDDMMEIDIRNVAMWTQASLSQEEIDQRKQRARHNTQKQDETDEPTLRDEVYQDIDEVLKLVNVQATKGSLDDEATGMN